MARKYIWRDRRDPDSPNHQISDLVYVVRDNRLMRARHYQWTGITLRFDARPVDELKGLRPFELSYMADASASARLTAMWGDGTILQAKRDLVDHLLSKDAEAA